MFSIPQFWNKFLQNENLFFEKLDNSFALENTTIESITYRYKTTHSEDNVKTNRMGSTKLDLSQRMQFCQYLLYLFENFVSV